MSARRWKSRWKICCAGLLLLTACRSHVDADAELLGECRYEPRPASHFVATFENERDITRKWTKVGIVHGRGKPQYLQEIGAAMKVKARSIGGDALVVREVVAAAHARMRRNLIYREAMVVRYVDGSDGADTDRPQQQR